MPKNPYGITKNFFEKNLFTILSKCINILYIRWKYIHFFKKPLNYKGLPKTGYTFWNYLVKIECSGLEPNINTKIILNVRKNEDGKSERKTMVKRLMFGSRGEQKCENFFEYSDKQRERTFYRDDICQAGEKCPREQMFVLVKISKNDKSISKINKTLDQTYLPEILMPQGKKGI